MRGIHPRGQDRDHASGLERRIHDPDTLPSNRRSARSWPWDFPSPRARTPPGAIPTRLARAAWALRASVKKACRGARAPRSLALRHRGARPRAARVFLRASPRVPRFAGLAAHAGVADERCVRSTSALRNVPTEHSCVVASQRGDPGGPPSYRGFRLVLVRVDVCSARCSSRPETEGETPRGSGPLDANEAGGCRVSRRDAHFGDRTVARARRCLPSAWPTDRLWHLCRLLPASARFPKDVPRVGSKAAKTGSAGAS